MRMHGRLVAWRRPSHSYMGRGLRLTPAAGTPPKNRPMPATASDALAAKSESETETSAESARYAVLRRIGPALRHDLVVHLQALAMMSEVLAARLDHRPAPSDSMATHSSTRTGAGAGAGAATLADSGGHVGTVPPADLAAQLSRLHRLARDAVASSLQVADWLTPADDDAIDLREGLAKSLDLVRSSLGFRGFHLQLETVEASLPVSHDRLRHLLLAALLHLCDQARAPGRLRVRARVASDTALLQLALEAPTPPGQTGAVPPADDTGYRSMRWADVQALAGALPAVRHLTPLTPLAPATAASITLRLPRVEARTPLQMAPR